MFIANKKDWLVLFIISQPHISMVLFLLNHLQ
jgi:hypothetical protein